MSVMLASFFSAILAQATPAPVPSPSPTPLYVGNPAASMRLEQRPLGFDPDGNARWLVIVGFTDSNGNPTRIMKNSDLDYTQSRGDLQWQTRMRYGSPSAIVKTTDEGPIGMTVKANAPQLPPAMATTDTRTWPGPRTAAKALGPYMVQIGWFPRETRSTVRIVRVNLETNVSSTFLVAAPSSTYRDTSVQPDHRYRYTIRRGGKSVTLAELRTLPEPPATTVSAASGKASWLFFSTNPYDDNYYAKINPSAIIDQAVRAGLHYVELRTAYGEYWQITPEARPTMDEIIDGLAQHGIGVVGWTVPREPTFDDLAASVNTVYYRTAHGTGFTALAIDAERGEEYMGDCPRGCLGLAQYMKLLRAAVGPHYTVVATVEDPYLEHLTEKDYPYREIAQYSDVLQPMSYWRMMSRHSTNVAEVKELLRGSYTKLLSEAQRNLPVSIGGQTSAEGPFGHPPADEIYGSLEASKELGAIGEAFFDWDGTQPDQWEAISRYRW